MGSGRGQTLGQTWESSRSAAGCSVSGLLMARRSCLIAHVSRPTILRCQRRTRPLLHLLIGCLACGRRTPLWRMPSRVRTRSLGATATGVLPLENCNSPGTPLTQRLHRTRTAALLCSRSPRHRARFAPVNRGSLDDMAEIPKHEVVVVPGARHPRGYRGNLLPGREWFSSHSAEVTTADPQLLRELLALVGGEDSP